MEWTVSASVVNFVQEKVHCVYFPDTSYVVSDNCCINTCRSLNIKRAHRKNHTRFVLLDTKGRRPEHPLLSMKVQVQSLFLMLLYYYDSYCCFLLLKLLLSLLWQKSFFLWLQLHRNKFMFNFLQLRWSKVVSAWRERTGNDFQFGTAVRNVLPKVKPQLWFLPVWIQPLLLLYFVLGLIYIIWRFCRSFSLFKRKTSNLCLLQRENASFLFSVKFYGTDLYNFKSSYFSIHAEYSSITTKTC